MTEADKKPEETTPTTTTTTTTPSTTDSTTTAPTNATASKTVGDGAEDEQPKDNEHQRKVNVGNLPKEITEKELRDHFSGHEIERVDIFHYLKNTLAMLLLKDKEAAQKAIEEKDGSMLNGRRLRMHLEYIAIRYTKKDVIVTVVDDSCTEEQLYDRVKEHCEVVQVFIFHPLGYVQLGKDVDKTDILEKLNKAGLKAYDVNGRDQNQHVDIWRAAKLFFRNRNRVQLLNVPQKWVENTEELKKECSEAGTITEAVANNVNHASNYARIFYETEEQAEKAAGLLNGKVFDGKRIHALHLSSALLPNYKTSVYIYPLDKSVTEENVYENFKLVGEIDFVNRRNCGENAIICFKQPDAVARALVVSTFPTPTEGDPTSLKPITVKAYDGPLVLRQTGVKRKTPSSKPADGSRGRGDRRLSNFESEKTQKEVLHKLQAFHPVYVSNIPFGCPTHVIKEFFAQCGDVRFAFSPRHLTYRLSAPQPVKSAFVYFARRSDSVNAVKNLDKKVLYNHHLHVFPGRDECNFMQAKTVKLTKINESLTEDAIFRKLRSAGKVVRLTKKSRSSAFVEFADGADVEKLMKMKQEELPINCTFSKVSKDINRRLYNESDPPILGTIARMMRKNPNLLNKTTGAGPLMSAGTFNPKRPRLSGPPGGNQRFGNQPPPFNPNNSGGNNMNNNQAIQDLLRLAFMSGKNVGESLASGGTGGNQASNRGGGFNNADPPIGNQGSNAFGGGGDGGFRNNRNQNNQNFRNNRNNSSNRGNNQNSNNNFGGNNSQNQNNLNRGGVGGSSVGGSGGGGSGGGGVMNRNNQNTNNRSSNSLNKRVNNSQQQQSQLQQQQGNRLNNQSNRNHGGGGGSGGGGSNAGGVGNMNRQNNMGGGGGGGNRNNQNRGNNNNAFDNDGGYGGGNQGGGSFGGGNNFTNDGGFNSNRNNDNNFSNDNFGGGRNANYSNDNFGSGNRGGNSNNFGGRNNDNDNFGGGRSNNFGGGSNNFGNNSLRSGGGGGGSNSGGGGGSRFSNNDNTPFTGGNFNSFGGGGGSGGNNRNNNSSNSRFDYDSFGGGNNNRNFNNDNSFQNNRGGGGGGASGGNQKPQSLFNFGSGGGGGGGAGGGTGGGVGGFFEFNKIRNDDSDDNSFDGGNTNSNNFRGGNDNSGGGGGGKSNWMNNSGRSNNNQDNVGRLAGSIFSRRF